MNIFMVSYVLGKVCMFEAAFMALPFISAIAHQEFEIGRIYLICMLICLGVGALLSLRRPKAKKMTPKDGMAIVGLSWIVLSLLGALPFWISGEIPNYIDAFFETVSGFTTTGSTILREVESLSYASRFWRSFTHWIGGMGVLVFLLALLPSMGGSFVNLMAAESPGPDVSKLVPRVKNTAKYLYMLYFAMTVVQLVLLLLTGMEFFDAVTLTMGTAGTGGFAVRNDGFDSYTMLQTGIIAVFMLMFGINFNFYFLLLRKKFKQALHTEEVLTYLGIILCVTTVIVFAVRDRFDTLFEAIHHVFFTVVSLITTTGYATVDFNTWPLIAVILLLLIMCIGACAGSTGGGMKVFRVNMLLKGIRKEFQTLMHPRSVKKVRMDGKPVAHEVVRSINVFFTIYVIIFVVSLILISFDNRDFLTSFSSVAATLNNIGPGFGGVGPMATFADYSNFSKIVLSFDMLAGRLELLPILVLFLPSLWTRRRERSEIPEIN